MKSFLVMLMVLTVSGDDEVTIKGIIEDRVLLPCPCQNRTLNEIVKWQMEKPNMVKVLSHSWTSTNVSDTYKDRVETFLTKDINNCSLLLANLTADDQGTYRCSFTHKNIYTYTHIHLNISAHYNVCQRSVTSLNDSLSEKECDVEGSYRDTEILWYLDDQLLTNSTTTKIIHTYTLKAPTRHSFRSKIFTEITGTSELICKVKAKGISAIISYDCKSMSAKVETNVEPTTFRGYFKVIPIVLVIGLSLILLCRGKLSQGSQRNTTVKTNCSWW